MPERPLERQVEKYCARYKLVRAWCVLQYLLFAATGLAAVYLLTDKLFYFGTPTRPLLMGVAAAVLLCLLVCFLLLRRRRSYVCYLVDRSAGLKNLVASGLSVAGQTDDVSTVVATRAAKALTTQRPRRLIPFRVHWTGKHAYAPVLALLAALLIPQMDVLGRKEKQDEAESERLQVAKGALKLTAKLSSIDKQAQAIDSVENKAITTDFTTLADSLAGTTKKDALLKLGEFENKYKDDFSEARNFEQAAKGLPSRPDMKGLAPESKEQLQKLLRNLNDGKLRAAGKAFKRLAKQLDGKRLSPEQRKALARELAKLARQLQGAGMSDELAKLLSEIAASSEDLEKLLEQCRGAAMEMRELAKFCSKCDGLMAMRSGLAAAKKDMLGESFSGFDAMATEKYMEEQAALGLGCAGCSGVGCSACNGTGGGTGGKGRGRGGSPPENPMDTQFQPKMSRSKINKGRILHQLFVSGVPDKGEALAEYADMVRAAQQHAAGSLARDRIPREYENMVKAYFDSLEDRGDVQE